MLESRKNPRALTFRTAKVIFDGAAEPVDCAVLDISESGTCLLVADANVVPDNFVLQVDHDGWSQICRVVWRKQHRVGVRFVNHDAMISSAPQVSPTNIEQCASAADSPVKVPLESDTTDNG